MLKKNAKKLLISILFLVFSVTAYVCSPFLINFNNDKKTGIENLISELIFYKVNIKGNIQYKLNPLPSLEISEVHITNDEENSILNKIILNVSIFDLLNNKFSYKNIFINSGEFIINLNNLEILSSIEEFDNKKINFEKVNIKFFDKKQTFSINEFSGNILYKNKKIDKINGKFYVGEILFKIKFKENQLSLKSPEINFKANIENFLNPKKLIKLDYNNSSIFPGVDSIFASFTYEQNENKFSLITKEFETNIFSGLININNNNDKNIIVLDGYFENSKFKKISNTDLATFLSQNLNLLANLFDGRVKLSFNNFKSDKEVFENIKLNVLFQNGDVFFEDINIYSDNNSINIKGRNVTYQKDNLFFYDVIFSTKNLKRLCAQICDDKFLIDKAIDGEFKLQSKGILNINKSKITVQENFVNREFNDNEIQKLNTNLNSIVIFGKLENLFDLPRYFTLL